MAGSRRPVGQRPLELDPLRRRVGRRVERRPDDREDDVAQPAQHGVVVDARHPPERVLQRGVQPFGVVRIRPQRIHPGVEEGHQIVRVGRVGDQDAVGVAPTQRRPGQAQVTEQRPQQPHLTGGEPGGEHQRVQAVAVDVPERETAEDVAQPVHLLQRRLRQLRGDDHVVLIQGGHAPVRARTARQAAVGPRAQAQVGQHRYHVGDRRFVRLPGEPHRQRGGPVVGAGGGEARLPALGQPGQSGLGTRQGAVVQEPTAAIRRAYHPFSIARSAGQRTPAHRAAGWPALTAGCPRRDVTEIREHRAPDGVASAKLTRHGRCDAGRGAGQPAAPVDDVGTETDASGRRGAGDRPHARPRPGRGDHPGRSRDLVPGRGVRGVFRGRLRPRAGVGVRHRGRAARDRRRDPQRRVETARRPGRPGGRLQRRHPLRAGHRRAGAAPLPGRRGRHPAPDRGRRPAGVRCRLHRRGRPGHPVPGEDTRPADQPDQRGLLRVPPVGDRQHSGGASGLGRAGDLPRSAGRRFPGGRLHRQHLLAGPGHTRRVRPGLPGSGDRTDRLLGAARAGG